MLARSPEINSYALFIRDGMLERMQEMAYFTSFKKFGRSRQMQIQPQNLPFAGCYIVDEVMTPDGDLNAGDIRFTHTLRIGFSAIVLNNSPDETEDMLDAAFWAIMNGLLKDPTLMNMIESALPGNARIEGFSRGNRRHEYGAVGKDNELPIGEMRMELSCVFRTNWSPIIVDDLLVIHSETRYPGSASPSQQHRIQQVTSIYDMVAEDPVVEEPEIGIPASVRFAGSGSLRVSATKIP